MKKLVSWVEIPAINFEKAVEFYNKVLKVKLKVFDFEVEKMAMFPSGDGAISFADGFKPSKDGTLVSLNADDDLDGALIRVVENGGEIVIPKTKIQAENKAYFAIFIDCEGNRVGLYGE